MPVLVVEDSQVLADSIAKGLRRFSMAVDVCYDGGQALQRIDVNAYDVIVLDRDLPIVHGDDVCRAVMAGEQATRILMLAAVADRVDGLRLGADDYLAKPFVFAELIARIHALARRTPRALPPILQRDGVPLGPATASSRPKRATTATLTQGIRGAGSTHENDLPI
jgi:DNA-binding response OmpR family regulator